MQLDAIFGTQGDVSVLQECARAVLIFVYGLFALRVAGRRTFAQWTALDTVVAIVTGSSLSRALTGSAQLFGTLAATTLLLALHWLLAQGAVRMRWVSRIVEGTPVRLGQDGKVDPHALGRNAVSQSALDEALRGSGVETAAGTRLIVLEPSGKISVLKD